MSDFCRTFGISRKTGYKIFNRYKKRGLEAVTDRSRRPVHYANQPPDQVGQMIVRLKKDKPHWGARKIRELLVRRLAGWCADYKGKFKLDSDQYCYPLTVTDHASRMLLICEAHETSKEINAFSAFQRLFAEHGLPQAMRTDNGLPFASPNGLYNLSRLSVCWFRLGIAIERIRPGHPNRTAGMSACI